MGVDKFDTLGRYRTKAGLFVQLVWGGPFVRVPRVRERQRRALAALVERECDGVVQRDGREQRRSGLAKVLHALIGKGLVEVVGVNPGRYRVTRLGREVLRR